jgi:hypothetical protein
MSQRKCAHPAGCELLAAPGDIYCEGCATDPTLEPGPRCEYPDDDSPDALFAEADYYSDEQAELEEKWARDPRRRPLGLAS